MLLLPYSIKKFLFFSLLLIFNVFDLVKSLLVLKFQSLDNLPIALKLFLSILKLLFRLLSFPFFFLLFLEQDLLILFLFFELQLVLSDLLGLFLFLLIQLLTSLHEFLIHLVYHIFKLVLLLLLNLQHFFFHLKFIFYDFILLIKLGFLIFQSLKFLHILVD